jgi:pyruvate/2-oxoglutarate dehydrogenase complex dihydrolipoamide dehydrogenase (E3) component
VQRRFDVIVLGAGPCGEAVAKELAGSGSTVAVVESNLVGGECPYWGCVPSKTLLRSAEVVKEARRAGELAASHVELKQDFSKVARRTSWMARDLDDTRPALAIQEQAMLVRGQARLVGPGRVEVDGLQLRASRGVVVCTGSSPAVPPIAGLDQVSYWTNREAVLTKTLPKTLLVLGGGAIGVELAQAFARFGAAVTVVEGTERLIPAEDPEAGELLRGHLESDGVQVLTGAKVDAVQAHGGGVRLQVRDHEPVTAERLLVATGRRPNLDGFDLASAGLKSDTRGWLQVDPTTLLAGEGVWVGGDVTGIAGFTHVAHYHGTVIGRALRGRNVAANHSAVPRVTFTDPEVASVGLSEAQAREAGLAVRVARTDAAEAVRGYIHGFQRGLVKLVADLSSERLVGATIVSPRAGEMIGELTLAIRTRVPLSLLADTIHAFPTFSRVLQSTFDELAGAS